MEAVKLLYIEDNDEQRKTLAERLRKKGFQVTVARSGTTGIKFFQSRKFDAILCDLNMPGKGGEDVLNFVRKGNCVVPFVIMSAHGTVSQAVKTIKKGADHFILKPANINEITITIKQAIERRKLETELADSRAALQMVAESVPDIIYSLNTKGEFLNLSAAVKPSMGYKQDELLGASVFDIIHPDDRLRIMRDFENAIKSGGKTVRNLMFRMISKSGEVKHFEVSRRLIIEAGQVVRIDGIARDDTKRVMLQNKLEEYSQSLETMVADRTGSLEKANRQLSALNKVSNKINKIFDEKKLLDSVCALLTSTLDFDRAYLILARDKDFYIRSWCSGTGPRKSMENFVKKIEKRTVQLPPHVGESFKKKTTVFVRDINADRRWPKEPRFMVQAKSVVLSPIMVQRKVIGVICGSMDDQDRDMNKRDVERFEMFANMVGLALDNIRAYQSMEQEVVERTESLNKANLKLQEKAAELEDGRMQLAQANVDLLAGQQGLREKHDQMEQVLQELSKRSKELQIVVDSGPNAILLVDSAGTIQVANRRIQEYFGIQQKDVVGNNHDKFARSVKNAFEEPGKFLRLVSDLKKKPDVAGQLDLSEFYGRGLTVKGDKPIVLSPISLSVLDDNKNEIGRVWVYGNITKVKQADQQVHAIVKASPIPTIISRVDTGEILYANEQLGTLVRTTPENLLGKFTRDFYYHPEDRDRMLEILRRDGSVNDFEVEIKRTDGTVIWVIFSIVITEIAGDKVILGGLYDISERKYFEEALEKEHNFVSAVLDTAGALVMVVDREGKIVRFNRECEDKSGYSFDEVRDRPYWDTFVVPEELEKAKAFHEQLYAGQFPTKDESYWVTKSGDRRLIAWSNTCLLDGKGDVDHVVAIGIDITEHRKAEDNLKLFRELFLNANDGIVIFDAEGNFIEKNPIHGVLTGYTEDDFHGRKVSEVMGGDLQSIWESLDKKGSYRDEFEFEQKDGAPQTVDLSIFPIKKESGDLIGYAGIGRDITERKKAEEAIANRLRYEGGLAALSQTLLTRTGREDALPEALDHLLKGADASRVYIFENFEHKTDGLCMRQIYEVCAAGVEPQIDNPELQHIPYNAAPDRWRNMLSNGEPLKGLVRSFSEEEKAILEPQGILSMACIPFKVEGEWYGYVGFDEVKCEREWTDDDIRTLQTAAEIIGSYIEKQKFEETLRISEERFRSLVENANDTIYSLTPKGEFTYISPKVADKMGYEAVELLGKSFFPLLHPDDVSDSLNWFQSGFEHHEENAEGYEFRMFHRDGSTRWFTTNASQILDEDGNVMELIGVAHDITQMKMVLEEIEKANQHLKETQAQLAQADKMASLGMLVAGIAHEINTPMGAVNSMHDTLVRAIDKLKNTIHAQFDEERLKQTSLAATLNMIDDSNSTIKSGTKRVTNIVKRLRSFARLDEAELKTVDIHEGLEDTLTLIHHEIKHDITVRKNYGDVPLIACFPGQLNQVFLNLLVNARQAIKGKGEITIATYTSAKKVFIRIADTGSGISKENLSKIFDPGFTTKGVGVGTGLGLAICYKIMQDHKGEITVESELGKGTAFTVILPMNPDRLIVNQQ
jgi:PAS domain S-box-containing protein